MKPLTLGVIVGNRGFFPGHLCETGRKTILEVLQQEGINAVILGTGETPYGSVESLNDAAKCADLFKKQRDQIDGVLVTLPNFGDERAVANTLRWSELNVQKRRAPACETQDQTRTQRLSSVWEDEVFNAPLVFAPRWASVWAYVVIVAGSLLLVPWIGGVAIGILLFGVYGWSRIVRAVWP